MVLHHFSLFVSYLLKVLATTNYHILVFHVEFVLHLLLKWSNFIVKRIIYLLSILDQYIVSKLILISLTEHILLVILLLKLISFKSKTSDLKIRTRPLPT